jgi:hypothetical protein
VSGACGAESGCLKCGQDGHISCDCTNEAAAGKSHYYLILGDNAVL